MSVADIINQLSISNPRVLLCDQPLPMAAWPFFRPGAGAQLVVVPVPQGGGGKSAQRTLLTIAVIAASAYTGGAVGGGVWGAVASAAVSYGGMALVNQVAPPPEPKIEVGAPTREDQASITGTRNDVRKYEPIPRVYGLHRVYPPFAAEPYTEIAGNDVYLRALFCVGYGQLDISDIRIGETAIASYDHEIETCDLAAGDSVPTLYTDNVSTQSLSVTLEQPQRYTPGSWHTRTTEADTDEAICDLTFPGGLLYIDHENDDRGTRVEINVQYAVADSGSWVDAPLDPIGPSVTTPQDGVLLVEHRAAGLFRRGFRIQFPSAGQYDIRLRRKELRNTSDTYRNTTGCGDSWNLKYTQVVGSTTWYYCHEVIDPNWESGVIAETQWTALRSIVYESPIDTDQFDQGVYIALRIKATGELNGIIDQLNCLAQSKLSIWNGSSWTSPVATRNPAWIYTDILTGSANKRAISTDRLDTSSLKTWADNCTTEGRNFDYVFSGNGTVLERLRMVTGAARASWSVKDGLYSVIEDRAQSTVIQHLTPRNSWGFSASKVFADQPHGLKVQFVNADTDYQQDERIVYDDGYDAGTATKFESLKLPGVTDSDIAWKDARYHIATARLRPETYTINVDFEHLACTRGDLVRVSHDVMLVGLASGRIKTVTVDGSGNATGLTLDERVPMETGKTYGIRIRLATGDSVVATVTTNPGEQSSITLSPAIPAADAPTGGELFQFGESGLESTPMIIKSIAPRDDLTATLTLIDYSDAVYTADTGSIPSFSSNITRAPALNQNASPTPSIDAIVSDETALAESSDGSLRSQIRIDFSIEQDSTRPRPEVFHVEFRLADPEDDWVRLSDIPGDQRTAWCSPVVDQRIYDVRIRSVSTLGIVSAWTTESDHTVVGKTTPPDDVTGFSAQQNGSSVVLKWDHIAVKDLRGYVIRAGEVGNSSWENSILLTEETKGTTITDASLSPGLWDLFIKAVDTTGNYSTNAATATNVRFTTDFDRIVSDDQHPDWPGMADGFVRHPSGVLVPSSTALAEDLGWELFDTFVVDPVPISTYIAPELDSDYDDTVRIWAEIVATAGPGETGSISPTFEIATRLDGEVYTGYDTAEDWGLITDAVTVSEDWGSVADEISDTQDNEDYAFLPDTKPWIVGNEDARYVCQLVQIENTEGNVVFLETYTAIVDLQERTERHTDVVIAAGGTTVAYDSPFHDNPYVSATPTGTSARFITRDNPTTTGVTFYVWDKDGVDVGGTIDYEAKGV